MTIAEKITRAKNDYDAVYEAGKQAGGNTEEAFEAGRKAEYDAFWDAYQNNGNRTDYTMAFANSGWKAEIYNPKYPVKPKIAQQMYNATRLGYEQLKDVDFSNCTDFYQIFSYSNIEHLGIIDFTKATRTTQAFMECKNLHTIDKIISSISTSFHTATFSGAQSLENIIIEGTIGTTLSFQDCTKLSHDSIVSIITALSSSVSGKTLTLSKTAVNKAFETSEGANDGSTSAEWTTLENSKSNWTISLV